MKYDIKYLKNSLELLKGAVADIDMWSVYNDDKFNDEVFALHKSIRVIENKLSIIKPKSDCA